MVPRNAKFRTSITSLILAALGPVMCPFIIIKNVDANGVVGIEINDQRWKLWRTETAKAFRFSG